MKILIIDDVHELLTNGLTALGFDVTYQPHATRNDLLHIITAYDGLVVRTKTRIDREVIERAAKLKFIARAGAGLDNIDEDAAVEKRISVFNAGEANADAVGEHTLGMLLSLFTKLNKADKEVRSGIWDREGNRGVELSGKTVGIVGYGNTGRAVAKKLRGFDVRILAYDKYVKGFGNKEVEECEMDELFKEVDVITFHVPLTNETKLMVNNDYLQRFEKDIYLLNLCRGEVVQTIDLVSALKSGKVKGAALDVLENEKLDKMNDKEKEWMAYLTSSNRTVLSPHVAGWTIESYRKISAVLLKKISDLNLNESVS
jgi:D-3-phosphoglycerate dehydrogenase